MEFAGDGLGGIEVFGSQIEQGSFPSSYIPTTDSPVTRAADRVLLDDIDLMDWYCPAEGTLVVEASSNQTDFSLIDNRAHLAALSAKTSVDTFEMLLVEGGLSLLTRKYSGSFSTTSPLVPQTIQRSAQYRCVATYGNDSATCAINGDLSSDVTREFDGHMAKRLYVGVGAISSSRVLDGHIARLAYYPKRLTNDELIGATA